jgi:hypothetical protein
MAGKTVTAMPNSMVMIHDASGVCFGNQSEMQEMADLLNKVSQNLASIYAGRAGGTADEWRTAMKAETWYTADEAVEAGLADRVGDTDTPSDVQVASDRWNYTLYNYDCRASAPAPMRIGASAPQIPAPTPEAAVDAEELADLVAARITALILQPTALAPVAAVIPAPAAPSPSAVTEPTVDAAPVAVVETPPEPIPDPTPAAAPAVDPALADRQEDETPVWNADVFRLAMKERAAAQ